MNTQHVPVEQHIASIVDATMIFSSPAARADAIERIEFELATGIDTSCAVSTPRDMHSQIVGCLPTYLEIPTNA